MERINITKKINEFTSSESEKWEKLSSHEAQELYDIYNKNKYSTLIYSRRNTRKLREQIWWKWDILKNSDWKKIKNLIDKSSTTINPEENDIASKPKINENEKHKSIDNQEVWKEIHEQITKLWDNIWKINSVSSLKSYCENNNINVKKLQTVIWVVADWDIWPITFRNLKLYIEFKNRISDFTEENINNLSEKDSAKLFSIFKESEWIKKDCYSFIAHISKEIKWKFDLLSNFLIYNKIFNSKKNRYRWSLTQFLRIENSQETNFNDLMNNLENSPTNSIFLISMNTKWKPYYEHTWFITIEENGKIYFTHWETTEKEWKLISLWAIKEEVTRAWWYFDSSTIRKRYKKWFFNLKRIA